MFDAVPDDLLKSFSGLAPLFPLSEAVCFPQILLPLHIFEPRYRQMTADALEGDGLIAIAQSVPGVEHLAKPAIYEHVCVGRITTHERLADGRYYLLLQGLCRARVIAEEPEERPYRLARLELRPDVLPAEPTIQREGRRRELLEALHDLHPNGSLATLLHEAADLALPLGLVTDLIAASLPLSPSAVQELLAEENVDLRSDLLLSRLRDLRRKAQYPALPPRFPPPFSVN